ncbi:uncharacterized protein E0L32_002866 [Thyridium curvatum]|uniref:Mitochondrial carrier protein n=1 Tax=Thyridium curvatum TaxID=1093900 RepID=A0A507B3S5_9PEZI|nr:uncharacterized protein E0L32_002866 [Thyridium curvatum]TPX17765.1 hypothetical protein E0L32_002866 [Thyridium curvatum]
MTRRNDGGAAAAAAADDGGSLLPFPPPGEEVGAGILPVLPPGTEVAIPDKNPRSNAATAATAAGVRAFTAQAVAFYFRAPVKAFFRTRVDYLAYARSVQQAQQAQARAGGDGHLSFARRLALWARGTTPGVLTSAIKHHGWRVVPDQVLPPLLANVGVGAVLYTSYLQILGRLHEESAKASRRVYPPPDPTATFAAGFLAGSIQSVVAAPLDAIQARYDHRQLFAGEAGSNGGKPQSIWAFSTAKLREIGFRGIFAGWGLSWMKDSFGNAVFFSTFEYVKAQGYYKFVRWYYGGLNEDLLDILARKRPTHDHRLRTEGADPGSAPLIIRPHYAIEPAFLLLAGVSASVAQQVLLHPLTNIQMEHWDHLEDLDEKARKLRERRAKEQQLKNNSESATNSPAKPRRRWRMLRAYYHAYQETWQQCKGQAAAEGQSVSRWLWRGFWWNTIRQVPSTSAGLIIFELVRRKYGFDEGEVRITRDGYDILLK